MALRPRVRVALVATAAVIVLAAVGLGLAARWLLYSDPLRTAAEARLTTLLGQPVRIGRVRVSLASGLSVIGSNITVGAAVGERSPVIVDRIRIVPHIESLFSDRVRITRVQIQGLELTIQRDSAGNWHAPPIVPAAGGDSSAGGVTVERVMLEGGRLRIVGSASGGGPATTSVIHDIDAELLAEQEGLRLSSIEGQIGDADIRGSGRIDSRSMVLAFQMEQIRDDDLAAVLRLAGSDRPAFLSLAEPASLSFEARLDRAMNRLSGKGTVGAPQVLLDTLRIGAFQAPVTLEDQTLVFAPTTFNVYGGSHRGTLSLDLSQPARWSIDSKAGGVDIGDFLRALTGADQRLHGTASVSANLRGRVGEPLGSAMNGRAAVTVAGGRIRDFPLLAAVNRAARLAEGDSQETRFERLSATLAIAGGRAATNDLRLDAQEIRVEAAGTIGFDRTLDLAGLAVFSPERSARAIRSVRELSGLRNEEGEMELPIRITGSLDNPSFGIDLAAAARKSLEDELRRRLRRIIK
jgi:uncharacterized protein involved in outer membrane biogenesis